MAEPFARSFRFFDELTVRLEGDLNRGAARGFARKLKAYAVESAIARPDVTFRVAPFKNRSGPGIRRFNEYRVGAGYLCNTRRYKVARWTYDVAGMDEMRWVIRLDGNAGAHAMMHHLTMTSWVQLALAVRGYVPMHAAAVCRPGGGQGVLIAGRRGVGKTTLVGRLRGMGYKVVSEDRVFVRGGVAHGMRVPVNMKFGRRDPKLGDLPVDVQKRMKRNALIAKATRGYIALNEPVDAELLMPGSLLPSCELARVIYLQSAPGLLMEAADPHETARRIVRGNRFDDPMTVEDLLAYRYCFGAFAGHTTEPWLDDVGRLSSELSQPGVEVRRVMIPVSPAEAEWDRVMEEAVG